PEIPLNGERSGRVAGPRQLFSLTIEINYSRHHTVMVDLGSIKPAVSVQVVLAMDLTLLIERPLFGQVSMLVVVHPGTLRQTTLEGPFLFKLSVQMEILPRACPLIVLIMPSRLGSAIRVEFCVRTVTLAGPVAPCGLECSNRAV